MTNTRTLHREHTETDTPWWSAAWLNDHPDFPLDPRATAVGSTVIEVAA